MCDRFPRKFDVETSYNCCEHPEFPRATYHTMVPQKGVFGALELRIFFPMAIRSTRVEPWSLDL